MKRNIILFITLAIVAPLAFSGGEAKAKKTERKLASQQVFKCEGYIKEAFSSRGVASEDLKTLSGQLPWLEHGDVKLFVNKTGIGDENHIAIKVKSEKYGVDTSVSGRPGEMNLQFMQYIHTANKITISVWASCNFAK